MYVNLHYCSFQTGRGVIDEFIEIRSVQFFDSIKNLSFRRDDFDHEIV